jgi:hypothetical protein
VAKGRSLAARLKRDVWRPETSKIWVRKEVGWGWTVNLAAVRRRVSR